MASFWQRLIKFFSLSKATRSAIRNYTRRRNRRLLRLESLEVRTTMDAAIAGVVYFDANQDTVIDASEGLAGATVQLFNDLGTVGQYDSGVDTLVATTTSSSSPTALGSYRFTVSTAGNYLVRQTPLSGYTQTTSQRNVPVTISAGQLTSTVVVQNVDTFDTDAQNISVLTTNPISDSVATGIGGERDIVASRSSGAGDFAISVDQTNNNLLRISTDGGTTGTARVIWDGDGASDVDPLTADGSFTTPVDFTTNNAVGIRLDMRVDLNGASAEVVLRSASGSSTSGQVAIPQAATTQPVLFSFTSGTNAITGTADLTAITSVELIIRTNPDADVDLDQGGVYRLTSIPANLANTPAMTIGDQVFLDRNNDGILNGTDSGISGVTVQLYEDTNSNGVLDSTEASAQTPTSTTTNASGLYSFTNLAPGSYIVLIPNSQFATGQPLANFITSPGSGPVDTNNRDQGVVSGSLGVAAAVVLALGTEPTNDGDSDNNTNLTVDFGFTNTVLALNKTDTPDPVTTGGTLTYTLTATNNGPSNSTNTVISDTLPAGLTLQTATYTVNGGASQNATVVGSAISTGAFTLTATQQAVLTIVALVQSSFVNNTSNTGSVVSTEVPTPVQSTVTTSRNPDIDLGITKSIVGGATTVGLGGTFTYRLLLQNNSSTTVTGIEVTDNLPANFNPGTLPSGVTLDASTADPNDVIWAIPSLAGSGQITVDIPVTVGTTATLGTTTNTAIIDVTPTGLAGFNDTNSANNTSSVNIDVQPRYDLRVTKSDGLTTVVPGQTITYSLQAINDGPSSATNVVISDTLPSSLEFISSSSGSVASGVFTANVGTLASGASSTAVTIVARVRSSATGTTLVNTTTVAADTPTQESNTNNNSATDTDTLTRTVTLNVNKDDTVDPVALGQSFNYVITAFNSGNADTLNSIVTDVLPAGVEFDSGTFTINESTVRTGTVSFNSTTRTVTANLGTLLPGSTTTNRALITIVVHASTTATPGTVTNTARLVSDDNTTGVTNDETTQIVGVADLSGRVYVDANRNGVFDTGEAGVPNVTINVTGTSATGAAVNQTTTTDANGLYSFLDLPIGTYTVVEVQPNNYRSSATNVGTINGTASGTGTENQIATINLTGDSINNAFGELAVLSKRRFLSSST
ncbi:MAG: SdrD B-like domain-containing protein [Pirellulales bacterium]